MVQVLKEDVKQRIFDAAVEEFYDKDYKTATIRDIAGRAEVPIGLVYSYYENKEDLFNAIVEPIATNMDYLMRTEESRVEEKRNADPFNNLRRIVTDSIFHSLDNPKSLVVLMDKSFGTRYQDFKGNIIRRMELHIKAVLADRETQYDSLLFHIWASSLLEGICEIIRHYRGRKWAEQMLELLAKQYCYGINVFLE
ncbi:MAG TPA: TetR/AcrR family transcriptional regulator [Firmicutes bacterium]|jgi:AcrR family transcriptional regulator|nr:TetR/AcrR family transcriptional regulator [Bacillota bacterium]